MNTFEYNRAVDEYADGLYRYALSFCKNEPQAQDVVQTTFEKVWIKHKDIDYNKVKSYMFTTAHNLLINQKKFETRYSDEPEEHVLFTKERVNHDVQEILKQALDVLPEVQKSVVLLKDYEGYSYQEIGDMLKLSESQVKVYIFRARKSLKKIIGSVDSLL